MSKNIQNEGGDLSPLSRLSQKAGRRDFLKWSGAGAAALFVAGCDEATRTVAVVQPPDTIIRTDTVAPPAPPPPASVTLDFSNDFGVANYAYALEQLEAAFYMMVVAHPNFNATFSEDERRVLTDLRDHEVIHRNFFAAAIPALGGTAIPGLTPDFSSVNFNSRLSVLRTTQIFEDLGVAAYNGAARFIDSPVILGIAGKIVSVEARHASTVRDLLNPRSGDFAPRAFDEAMSPADVLAQADPFIRNNITITNA